MDKTTDDEIGRLYRKVYALQKNIEMRKCEAKMLVPVLRTLADCLDYEVDCVQIESMDGNFLTHTHPRKYTSEVTTNPRLKFPTNVIEIISDLLESQQKLKEAENYLAAKMECR